MMIAGVHDPRSLGVHRYVERLSAAMADLAIDYRPASRAQRGELAHFHLANSTRRVVLGQAARHRRPYLLTVHDVVPRARALRPFQRALVGPLCVGRAARVIVHSAHAADLLAATTAVDSGRIAIVPFPAPRPTCGGAAAARVALGLAPEGPLLMVVPGVLKGAKLVRETVAAARPLLATGAVRLLLAGRVVDERLADYARESGAIVLPEPPPDAYEHAIVAADVVICARSESVGETNAPLLDAIGAGRPSLVTAVGSAPEVAGQAARVITPTVAGIRAGIEALLDEDERCRRAAAARDRARELTWEAAAVRHAELFEEIGRA